MKTRQYYLAGFIAMISLILVCPVSAASSQTSTKATSAQINLKIEKAEAKATVLAKGQNHLPKHIRNDC